LSLGSRLLTRICCLLLCQRLLLFFELPSLLADYLSRLCIDSTTLGDLGGFSFNNFFGLEKETNPCTKSAQTTLKAL
jgi:hypothetical protein